MSTTGWVGYVDAREALFTDDDASDYTAQWLDQFNHWPFLLTSTLRITALLVLIRLSRGTVATFTAGIGEIGIKSVAAGLDKYLSSVWIAVEKFVFVTTVLRCRYRKMSSYYKTDRCGSKQRRITITYRNRFSKARTYYRN